LNQDPATKIIAFVWVSDKVALMSLDVKYLICYDSFIRILLDSSYEI